MFASLRFQAIRGIVPSNAARLQQRFMSAKSLVILEHDGNTIAGSSLAAVTAATGLKGTVTALVAGKGIENVVASASKIQGVSSVIAVDAEQLQRAPGETWADLLEAVQKSASFTHIVAGSSSLSRSMLPRLAAQLDTCVWSEVLEIKDESTFKHPIYAGNALETVKSSEDLHILSIRPTAFAKAAILNDDQAKAVPFDGAVPPTSTLSTWVEERIVKSDRPDLTAASVVVSGGRGLKSGENFELLYRLADALGGAVGASRAAVDAGFVANELQVGQTGKVVAPDLYIAVGISGAIQHLAGMKDSKVIVAINKDAEAPIFQVADYGLVADLFNVVPEFSDLVEKSK